TTESSQQLLDQGHHLVEGPVGGDVDLTVADPGGHVLDRVLEARNLERERRVTHAGEVLDRVARVGLVLAQLVHLGLGAVPDGEVAPGGGVGGALGAGVQAALFLVAARAGGGGVGRAESRAPGGRVGGGVAGVAGGLVGGGGARRSGRSRVRRGRCRA